MENEDIPLSEDLIVFCSDTQAQKDDIDMSLAAHVSLEKAKNSYQSFEWCLANLHDLQTKKGREFAINTIYRFINSNWYQIPESIYPRIIEELFTNIWKDENYQDKEYHPIIYETQNRAIFFLYPKYWSDFFDFLLNLPKPNLYGFLSSFNYSILTSASPLRRNIDEFKNNCLNDGSQAKILQTVVNDVLNGVEGAESSLISTVEWVSFSLLKDSDLIALFAQLVSQSCTCSTGLQIFITIFHRPIGQDVLYELVTQLQLDEIIQQIVTNCEGNTEIIVLCSELLFSSFSKLVSSEIPSLFDLISNVTEISMNLFMFPDKNSTSTNKSLLLCIFNTYPMLIPDYLPKMIEKILSSISLNSEDSYYITQASLNLFFIAVKTSGVDIVPHLFSLAEGLNPNENISEFATLLASLNELLPNPEDDGSVNELLQPLAELFSPLLTIQPPYCAPHFVAMTNYLQIIQPIVGNIDPEIRSQIFVKCIELIMCKECEITVPNDRDKLIESIFEICSQNPEFFVTIPGLKEMIPDFIQSEDPYLIKSAALISSTYDPEERYQLYSQALEFFADYLKLSIAPQQEKSEKSKLMEMFTSFNSNVRNVLYFLILAKTDDLESLKPILMTFFSTLYKEKYHEVFDDNQSSFTLFCNAAVKHLGFYSFEIFWGTSKFITEYENAAVIVNASIDLAENATYDDNLKQVFQLINNVVDHIYSSKKSMKRSYEEMQMKEFCRASADFLMLIMPKMNQEENGADFTTSISILVSMLTSKNLDNSMMNKVILFFLGNPPPFVEKINDIFYVFMIILNEFNYSGSIESAQLLINILHLLKELRPGVDEMSWESPKWEKFAEIFDNGPKIMDQIMESTDETFEPMVNEFLDNVAPPKVVVEDDYAADTED